MKAFTLIHPTTLEQTLAVLAETDAGAGSKSSSRVKVLAGGQDLLTEMKEHLVEPERLVNLKGVPGLDRIDIEGDGSCTLGALVTIAALEEHPGVRERFAVIAESAASVASPQIRSIGTVGGNLCQRPRCWYYRNEHAKCLKKGGDECFSYSGMNKYNAILGGGPSYIVHPSDLAPALVALDAEVTLQSTRGERRVKLADFYTLPIQGNIQRESVLAPDEVLTHVHVAAPGAGMKSTYAKFRERGSFDFALASVAVCLWNTAGVVRRARVVLGGVAPVPWHAAEAEKALVGRPLSAATIEAAAVGAVAGAEPLDHNGYKIPLTKGILTRALQGLA